MATVCCNACRTCVSTNVLGIVTAAVAGAAYSVANFARQRFTRAAYAPAATFRAEHHRVPAASALQRLDCEVFK
jgi:hypothetical protein